MTTQQQSDEQMSVLREANDNRSLADKLRDPNSREYFLFMNGYYDGSGDIRDKIASDSEHPYYPYEAFIPDWEPSTRPSWLKSLKTHLRWLWRRISRGYLLMGDDEIIEDLKKRKEYGF